MEGEAIASAATRAADAAILDSARQDKAKAMDDTDRNNPVHASPFSPQQFIDDVINAANDILEEAFDVMEESAPRILRISSDVHQEDIQKGFDAVYNSVQQKLEKNLCCWEAYTLSDCFAVPDKLPKHQENILEESSSNRANAGELDEERVDAELQAVRSKLAIAGKEVAKMRRELRSMEMCLSMRNKHKEALQEAVKQLDEVGEHEIFEEMIKTAKELKTKLYELKARKVQSPRGIRLTKNDLKDYQLQDLTDIVNSLEPVFSAEFS